MSGLDGARSHTTSQGLPLSPTLTFRARISGGVRGSVCADERGHVIASTLGNALVEVDEKGNEVWSARPPAGMLSSAPAILSDGSRVALTTTGSMLSVAAAGSPVRHVGLPLSAAARPIALLPVQSGGVVVGAGREILWLAQDLSVRASAKTDEDLVESIERGGNILLVTGAGEVLEWRPPDAPRRIASFGGKVRTGALLSSKNHVSAVVDDTTLIDVNLKADTRHIRTQGTTTLEGPPTLLRNGELLVMDSQGLILGFSQKGLETWRVATEPGVSPSNSSSLGGLRAPAIVGGQGRVAIARPGLDVAVVSANGSLLSARGTACPDPESLVPAGPARLVLACASGELFGIANGKKRQ